MKINNQKTFKPILLIGFGEINFGKQYRQGNRVYDSRAIAMALAAQPVGNTGGYTYLYLVEENDENDSDRRNQLQPKINSSFAR